jgi:hypothetical protein
MSASKIVRSGMDHNPYNVVDPPEDSLTALGYAVTL